MKFNEIWKKLKKKWKKSTNFLKNIKIFKLDEQDRKVIFNIIGQVILFGGMSSLAIFVIFRNPFTWYSFVGYGFTIYLLETKLVKWIRSIRFK